MGLLTDTPPVRLVPLGGLGEFGMNALVLEWNGHLLLVDAGMAFASAEMPGVDSIVPGIPATVLTPRESWADKAAYDKQAATLVGLFEKNFSTFADAVGEDVKAVAIRAAA